MKPQLLFFLLLLCTSVFGQYQLKAERITEHITVDGALKEEIWSKSQRTQGFTQIKPYPGKPSIRNTEVSVLYNDEALYIGVICHDQPDSVSRVLSIRDEYSPNLDVFGVFIDTYNDNQNGFYFGVTSRGVQLDAKILSNDFNDQLNLVWNSAVTITDEGWEAEMWIPYSALRFPKKPTQDWGINFSRDISRYRESSTWHPVNPDLENYLLDSGDLTNLENIEPPLRLALIPYLSSYVNHSKADGSSFSYNGGMDIKYGINEALTLDVTLVPDFGQVVFDQQVLNISPFELQFNENRQFFTEGTELFTKAGLFYSRRIGIQAPYSVLKTLLGDNEYLSNIPSVTQLYNASKLSGRLKNGLGIGIFNAVTAQQYATAVNKETKEERQILASPLTNYNVVVLDQNLKNNSSITFTNTSVMRAGSFYDANVTGLNFNINTKGNKFNFNGKGTLSAKLFDTNNDIGYNYNFNFNKQRGAFIYGVGYLEESDKFDPNDLGFNAMNNRRNLEASFAYRVFKPKSPKLTRLTWRGSVSMTRLFAPNVYTGSFWSAGFVVVTRNFDAAGITCDGTFTNFKDYFEPRTWGYMYDYPFWQNFGFWISSNYQKRIALDAGANYVYVNQKDWNEYNYYFNPRFRLSDHIFVVPGWSQGFELNSRGFAYPFGQPSESVDGIVFGQRNRINTTTSISLDYNITNRMNLTFRLRHYRSTLHYFQFFTLQNDGSLSPITYSGLDTDGNSAYDINYNAFTIDMQYRWVFQPGSEINFVWKNSIFASNLLYAQAYWNNMRQTFENGPMNSVSLKLIYWLDAPRVVKHLKNRRKRK